MKMLCFGFQPHEIFSNAPLWKFYLDCAPITENVIEQQIPNRLKFLFTSWTCRTLEPGFIYIGCVLLLSSNECDCIALMVWYLHPPPGVQECQIKFLVDLSVNF